MKTILPSLVIATATLLVGACASHQTVPVTTTTTSETREVPAPDLTPAATSTTTTRTDEVHTY